MIKINGSIETYVSEQDYFIVDTFLDVVPITIIVGIIYVIYKIIYLLNKIIICDKTKIKVVI